MANIERIYNIVLRREVVKTQKPRRSKKAMSVIRQFVEKHMKSKNVVIDGKVNEYIWGKGIKNPPSRVRVKTVKDESGKVKVTLEE